MRVLVVEDEMLIAFLIEDLLNALGHEVVGTAMRLPQALALAASTDIDLAILDVNLDGVKSFPVADTLAERGVPFIFATGYGRMGLDAPYDQQRVIGKPVTLDALETAINSLAA